MKSEALPGMSAAGRSIAIGLCLVLAYLAVACAAWNLGSARIANRLQAVLPVDPDIVMARAMERLRTSGGRLSSSDVAEVRRAAALDPLEEEPFLLAALAGGAGEPAKRLSALALLREARRRNPRSVETRIALLRYYLQARDIAAAVREIGPLGQLLPQGRDELIVLLAGLVRSPETRRDAVTTLGSTYLHTELLEKLASDGDDAGLLLDVADGMSGRPAMDDRTGWARRTLEALTDRGDYAGARRLWARLYGIEARQARAVPFAPRFSGIGGPPFGWKVSSGPAGIAEISGEALRIEYFGRDQAEFARQLLTLRPGSYRLRFGARRSGGKPLADLAWRVACVETGIALLDLPIASSLGAVNRSAGAFAVPQADCPAQWLLLIGRPDALPRTRPATILQVTLEGVEAP